jgi:enoyl-CoA hydratase/carnithine racemase
MTEHVIVTDADGIRTIRMNRPDKKNALTLAMYEAMTAALEGANADDSVHCVLIAGVPGAFSAGNDLADFSRPRTAQAASIARRCASCLRSFAATSRWSRP